MMKRRTLFLFLVVLLVMILMPAVNAGVLDKVWGAVTGFVTNYDSHKEAYNFILLLIIFIAAFSISARKVAQYAGWEDKSKNAITALGVAMGFAFTFAAYSFLKGRGVYFLDYLGPFSILALIVLILLLVIFVVYKHSPEKSKFTPFFIAMGIIILFYVLGVLFPGFPENFGEDMALIIYIIYIAALVYAIVATILFVLNLFGGLSVGTSEKMREYASRIKDAGGPEQAQQSAENVARGAEQIDQQAAAQDQQLREFQDQLNRAQAAAAQDPARAADMLKEAQAAIDNERRANREQAARIQQLEQQLKVLPVPDSEKEEAKAAVDQAKQELAKTDAQENEASEAIKQEAKNPTPEGINKIKGLLPEHSTLGGVKRVEMVARRAKKTCDDTKKFYEHIAKLKVETSGWLMREIRFLNDMEKRLPIFIERKVKYRPRSERREFWKAKQFIAQLSHVDYDTALKMAGLNNKLLTITAGGGEISKAIDEGITYKEELEALGKKKLTPDQERATRTLIQKSIEKVLKKLDGLVKEAIKIAEGLLVEIRK